MTEFEAIYYDGRTSARTPVRVRAAGESLRITGPSVDREVLRAGARADAPLPGMARALRLDDGACVQTDDVAAFDALFLPAGRLHALVPMLERRWRYALGGLAVVVALSAWCVVYGLPLGAALAARWISPTLERSLGERALKTIDGSLCTPSAAPADRREAVRRDFGTLTTGMKGADGYRVELRSCRGIGPNAFALPGGIVVVTDALLRVLPDDRRMTAVLAHELGHAAQHHALREALQTAGAAALVSAVAGDAVSITALATTLPTLLLERGYSRGFEDDADTFAFGRLEAIGSSPAALAEALEALERARPDAMAASPAGGPAMDYLSTHPATERRIARALGAG